jgi:hypothetical protein
MTVFEKLQRHYDHVISIYGEKAVVGVFLYGSQNYQCATEDSDVDTKCILVPNLWHLAIEPYKTVERHVAEEHCECMTISHMIANFKKQNINFLEILFTDYKIVNPIYEDLWNSLRAYRESIARYDPYAAIKSIGCQALHTIRQNPMDAKKIANGYRLYEFLVRYSKGIPYCECLIPSPECLQTIMALKRGERQPVFQDSEFLLSMIDALLQKDWAFEKMDIDDILNDYILSFIEKRISLD